MTQREFVESLTEKNIMSVYSGVNGKCCCGCAGKHTTNPLYRALRAEERGYDVDDEECNAKTVKMILNKIKRHADRMNPGDYQPGDFVSVVIGNRPTEEFRTRHSSYRRREHLGRLYVAYLVPSDEDLVINRKRRAENKVNAAEAKVAALQGAGI